MKSSRILCLAIAIWIVPGLVVADDAPTNKTVKQRTFALFQQYVKARDWQMAEVVAHGAVAKFGDDNELLRRMHACVGREVEGHLNLAERFAFLPNPKLTDSEQYFGSTSIRSYDVADLLVTPSEKQGDIMDRYATLSTELEKACGAGASRREFEIQYFRTNLAYVVNGSPERHAQVAAFLKSKREQTATDSK